jgi:outer membrane protein
MSTHLQNRVAAIAALCAVSGASAQVNVVKIGITEYTTKAQSSGVTGIGVPPGANVTTGDATTVILSYERMVVPNVGVELVVGIPPTIKANATGSVAFLGNDVLSAKFLSPVLFVNYHFFAPGATWRPYVGAGLNYTKFIDIKSTLASNVQMGYSTGWAAQVGLDHALNKQWSVFASVAALKVKSNVVAAGATVLQSTVDFRPIAYTIGAVYGF